VGYDNSIGYLDGGFEAWKSAGKEYETITRVSVDQAVQAIEQENMTIIDVRRNSEFASEHLVNAINIPLRDINDHLAEIPKNTTFVLHCAGGYRSMIAASILKMRGWDNFIEVEGGFNALAKTSLHKTEYVCPSTLL
jgi:rhodanese-related sulfurtransferase